MSNPENTGTIVIKNHGTHPVLCLKGEFRGSVSAAVDALLPQLKSAKVLSFDTTKLTGWDASLAVQIRRIGELLAKTGGKMETSGLPGGLIRLIHLADQGSSFEHPGSSETQPNIIVRTLIQTGEFATSQVQALINLLAFIGEVSVGCLHLLRGKARYRREDFLILLQTCGAEALPIISMISLVIGVIFAFVGSVQLRLFGAQIYVADIVGIGMAREMGAMMTGIIMAGRTGAAFAAQLGTMQVNEEVDALSTMGMNPVEYLVVPRLMALFLMMPLLCVYAIFTGIAGGMIIGVTMLDISIPQYFAQTRAAVDVGQFAHGIAKSGIFGVIIAVAGCYHGMGCGRSASAVGDATTKAVVSAIVAIILADGFIAVVSSVLGV